ncbi:hypothetical protein N9R81_02430 [Flavobacteriales bacterium]|nr:hypothetical protein [Flavobacteriales bacterium]
MKTTKILVGILSLALISGAIVSCKKKKDNKRIIGSWTANEFTETIEEVRQDAVWTIDVNGNNTKAIEKTTTSTINGLTSSSEKETVVSSNGETTITNISENYTQTLTIQFNEDGTMTYSSSSKLNSQTVSTSPANNCDASGGTAGLTCDGTYTYVSDNTESYTASGMWYWGNDTDDRSTIVMSFDGGDTQTWMVDELDKGVLNLSRVESVDEASPADNTAGTDTYVSSTNSTLKMTM